MKDKKVEIELDQCVQERKEIFGVTSALVVEYPGTRSGSRLCDYKLTFYEPDQKEKKKETRGYREMRRSRGKFVPPIAHGALRDELIILAGAEMSASDVVHTLRNFADQIEEHGLWIGKYRDDYIVETTDRALTVG